VNVLLLGGDAGPGRWGLRTDAMHVVSVDLDTGDLAVVSVPRNLYGAPLPPALRDRFPRGFTNLANAVYGWGESHPDLVNQAVGKTDAPGASLTAAMVAELTGMRIDAWVLADMQGFLELVDAFGGVDVYVPKRVPAAGNVPGGKHPVRDFRVGWHRMDGTDALSYARSRKADSDYQRMTRQRCVLASLVAQTDPTTLAWRWPQIASVLTRSLRTNLTPELLDALKGLAGVDTSQARTLSLNPPLVPTSRWDAASVRALVASTVTPPASTSAPTGTVIAPVAPATTTPQAPIASSCRVKP
jgi:LCP family protein required for cell wall assembly